MWPLVVEYEQCGLVVGYEQCGFVVGYEQCGRLFVGTNSVAACC